MEAFHTVLINNPGSYPVSMKLKRNDSTERCKTFYINFSLRMFFFNYTVQVFCFLIIFKREDI
jgi:hypothetical protein